VTDTLRDLTEETVLSLSAAAGEPDWLRDRRQEAFKAFSDLDWPHARVEEWRYTDPRRFDLTRAILARGDLTRTDGAGGTGRILAALPEERAGFLRMVDGRVAEATVSAEASARGVVVADLASAAREHEAVVRACLGSVVGPDTKFDALNLAAFTGGAFVYVPADVELAEPLTIGIEAASEGAALPRLLVVLGPHAKADLYIDHGGDAPATVVEVVEVVVGEGSRASVVTAQDWGAGVDHIATHTGLVRDNADYRHLEVTLGGKTLYIRPDLRLVSPGGNGELLGVYFCDADQHVEHRSVILHEGSHTTSNLVYKGALQGRSSATFFGNIRIEPQAKATSSDQTNRNLILTDGAKADSIPFLEIHNSDVVRCGHHSSVGQVDEEQVFYLRSRGLTREEAVRLLVFGFFAEVMERINLPAVTDTVLREIEQEIRALGQRSGRAQG
jgi:Fe-S cluster assembly protein SufD